MVDYSNSNSSILLRLIQPLVHLTRSAPGKSLFCKNSSIPHTSTAAIHNPDIWVYSLVHLQASKSSLDILFIFSILVWNEGFRSKKSRATVAERTKALNFSRSVLTCHGFKPHLCEIRYLLFIVQRISNSGETKTNNTLCGIESAELKVVGIPQGTWSSI